MLCWGCAARCALCVHMEVCEYTCMYMAVSMCTCAHACYVCTYVRVSLHSFPWL